MIIVTFREWSLFTAGGGGKREDIEFECKQLEGGKSSMHSFKGGGAKFECTDNFLSAISEQLLNHP